MRIEIRNKLEEVGKVIQGLSEFSSGLSLDVGVVQAAELALDELLSNVISYAYLDSEQHKIEVDMSIAENELQIVISDDGIAFNPFEQKAPDLSAAVEERDLGGVGIHLVEKFMDKCAYQRLQGHNVVTLVKSLGVKNLGDNGHGTTSPGNR